MTPDPPPDSSAAWTLALRSAVEAIHAADPTDLRALQRGVDLACHAAVAATSTDIWAALRWVAVSEQVIAVAHDLAAIPDPATTPPGATEPAAGLPAAPMPNTPAVHGALRDLWEAIHAGLRRYMTEQGDGIRVYCAAITAWSAMRLIEAGTRP